MVATNKAQHTPGPWKAFEYREDSTGEIVIGVGTDYPPGQLGDGSRSIVTMTGGYYTRPGEFHKPEAAPINRANARLIAAAPELLEALEEAERVIRLAAQESTGRVRAELVGGWLYHANKIGQTIARATGSTPQGTAAAVAVALGRSPTEPGTARLAADLEAAEDRKPSPGMVIVADWAGGDAQRMRLVSRYEHPAGNGWRVNIYDHRAKRFCKIEQSVSDQTVEAALLAGRVE